MTPSPADPSPIVAYATFWQRFAATLIDVLVLLPAIYVSAWLSGLSREMAMILVVPHQVIPLGYTIYCHGRFGRTLGKHVMRIRVARLDGSRIGWREAWLRSGVDILICTITAAGMFTMLARVTPSEFAEPRIGLINYPRFPQHEPGWMNVADIAYDVWAWSEIIVMLLNKERRALHDFIAGTIVVQGRTP